MIAFEHVMVNNDKYATNNCMVVNLQAQEHHFLVKNNHNIINIKYIIVIFNHSMSGGNRNMIVFFSRELIK